MTQERQKPSHTLDDLDLTVGVKSSSTLGSLDLSECSSEEYADKVLQLVATKKFKVIHEKLFESKRSSTVSKKNPKDQPDIKQINGCDLQK